MKKLLILGVCFFPFWLHAQNWDEKIDQKLLSVLYKHKELVSIPNLPVNVPEMERNMRWVTEQFQQVDFDVKQLPSTTLPVLFAERIIDKNLKTILFYFHLDGQPVNPEAWNQENPFVPVLKAYQQEKWIDLDWNALNHEINDDWRIFARAAADDKAPIVMMLSALELLKAQLQNPKFNIKIIFDLEEEYSSKGFLSTLKKYKETYAADYMIIMDGPAHSSNKPTLTFGCRGIATCSITTYGSKLPQHSGHYGNYVPNPVFGLSSLLASMKDDSGKVLIEDYYKGIDITSDISKTLNSVPYDAHSLNTSLGIHTSENVGENYQESLQYPSLNVRQVGTSWKGEGLKTIIPENATAYIDVRLVTETDGALQLEKIKKHIRAQGFIVLDREPTDEERLKHPKIVKFLGSSGVNAFRTNPNSEFGEKLKSAIKKEFEIDPIAIRTMGGTVPIIPAINELKIPAIIVPMVNMDNNQHSPNENIRIGNIRQGIKICLAILNTDF